MIVFMHRAYSFIFARAYFVSIVRMPHLTGGWE